MKKPTTHQMAVLRFVASENIAGHAPVEWSAIRKADGVVERHLTGTVCACINAGWLVVPTQGVAAYNITNAGLRVVGAAPSEKLTSPVADANFKVTP